MLESARVLKAKGIAFVTYTMRCSAEFAKEAMAEQVGSPTDGTALRADCPTHGRRGHLTCLLSGRGRAQSLDNDEQINVRWAYDDPNPRAQAMRLRNDAQTVRPSPREPSDHPAPWHTHARVTPWFASAYRCSLRWNVAVTSSQQRRIPTHRRRSVHVATTTRRRRLGRASR